MIKNKESRHRISSPGLMNSSSRSRHRRGIFYGQRSHSGEENGEPYDRPLFSPLGQHTQQLRNTLDDMVRVGAVSRRFAINPIPDQDRAQSGAVGASNILLG